MSKRTASVIVVFLLFLPFVAADIVSPSAHAQNQRSDLAEKLAELVRREMGGEETTYGDYRSVDGEMVPFTIAAQGGYLGRIVVKMQEVKFNTPIPRSAFRPAATSTARADQVDDYIGETMRKRRIPGLALAVVKDGKVIKAKGYGIANRDTGTPVTPESVFELASITKTFTATSIMLLVEDGKLSVDGKISKYLENTPASWANITVRHLLTHTSGFPSLFDGFKSLVWKKNMSTREMYDAARKDTLAFPAGDQWLYSDEGYFLLGMITERVSGKKYGDFLVERIFRPAGMTNSSALDQRKAIKNRARGYTLYKNKIVDIRRDTQLELSPYAGMMSTVLDLANWDAALRSGKILKQSSLDLMWTAVRLNDGKTQPYGFGWELDEHRGHKIVGHGGITGTQVVHYVNDGLTIIVLTNLGSWGPEKTPDANLWGANQNKKVAEFYIAYRPIPDPDPSLTALVKSLFSQPIGAGWDQKLFTPELWVALHDEYLSVHQEDLKKSLGPLQSIELVEQWKEGAKESFHYRLRYDRMSVLLELNRDGAGKFAGFDFHETP